MWWQTLLGVLAGLLIVYVSCRSGCSGAMPAATPTRWVCAMLAAAARPGPTAAPPCRLASPIDQGLAFCSSAGRVGAPRHGQACPVTVVGFRASHE